MLGFEATLSRRSQSSLSTKNSSASNDAPAPRRKSATQNRVRREAFGLASGDADSSSNQGGHHARVPHQPTTREIGLCSATKKPCPYGGAEGTENHYDNMADAAKAATLIEINWLASRGNQGTFSAKPLYTEEDFKPDYLAMRID